MKYLIVSLCISALSLSAFAEVKVPYPFVSQLVEPLAINIINNSPELNSSAGVVGQKDLYEDLIKVEVAVLVAVQSATCSIESIESFGINVDHAKKLITAFGFGEASRKEGCLEIARLQYKQLVFSAILEANSYSDSPEELVYKLGYSGFEVVITFKSKKDKNAYAFIRHTQTKEEVK